MPFVCRDTTGAIVGVSQATSENFTEEVAADSAEIAHFLDSIQSGPESLKSTDQGLIRVLEDVINLLVEKDLIKLSELPPDAQDKISTRQKLRDVLRGH